MPLPGDYVGSGTRRNKKGKVIMPISILTQTWTNPAAAVTNGLATSHAGAAAAGTTNPTLNGSLVSGGVGVFAHARNVVITVTHASAVVAMSGVITGTDINGNPQTEAWSVTATGTSKTFTGKKAFKTVTGYTEVVAADASANTIIAGSGAVLGFENPNEVASAIKEISAGSVVTNGTLSARSTASTDDTRGTYAPNSAPNGSTSYTVFYLSKQPETSK